MKYGFNVKKSLILIALLLQFHSCRDDSKPIENEKLLNSKGILLTTRFHSLEHLREQIEIEYLPSNSSVRLSQGEGALRLQSILHSGLKESDLMNARKGGLLQRIVLGLSSPKFIFHRKDMLRVWNLSRRRALVFGGGDVAFFDLAQGMVQNIYEVDRQGLKLADLSEKGFINTFNHVNSQAFMTMLFSENLADFVADTHERSAMPELITGDFTREQVQDVENGVVDNYVDLINNEWGQELGKKLSAQFLITRNLSWSPQLLADVLNELQSYYSWVFGIGFKPFRSSDPMVVAFSTKLNKVLENVDGML